MNRNIHLKLKAGLAIGILAATAASNAQDEARDADPSASVGATGTGSGASGAFNWKFRPAVGSRYEARFFQKTRMNMTIPAIPEEKSKAMPMVLSMVQRIAMSYDILSRDAFNATTMRCTFRSVSGTESATMNGSPMPGSASREASRASRAVEEAMEGAFFTMKVAPDGKVWSVKGLEALNARLANAMSGQPGAAAATSQFLNEKSLKRMFEQSAQPREPIAVNDAWSYNIDIPLSLGPVSQRVGLKGKRRLASRSNGRASINESGTFCIDLDTGRPPSDRDDPQVRAAMKGILRGVSVAQESTSVTLESNLSMDIQGTMHMTVPVGPSRKPKPLRVPLLMAMQIRSTFVPVGQNAAQASLSSQ